MNNSDLVGRIRPNREIHGISAVFLPHRTDGAPDLDGFATHLLRTHRAGLEVAVNMDTGFGPQLSPADRREVLRLTRETLGPQTPFVAGAMPFGHDCEPLHGYIRDVEAICEHGATPIVFPSEALSGAGPDEVASFHRRIVEGCERALAFELGTVFAPFGRIYDTDTVRRLIEIPALTGLKHSSLDRSIELERLELRDRERPDFRIYTGNDLAIDMVVYGSDYLLGLSTFDPRGFAERDRLWRCGDPRFYALNDALQAVGSVAFRDPVPAYKDSAARYLTLTGQLEEAHPHPTCPRRPPWETDVLRPLADRVANVQ